ASRAARRQPSRFRTLSLISWTCSSCLSFLALPNMVAREFVQGCSPIMVNVQLPASQLKLRTRRIETADGPDVVNLLARGFERARKRAFWDRTLSRLAAHSVPPGF